MNINNIAKEDFMNYAMEVIKNRAIPNIEDNLKSVHRRILFSMYTNKLWAGKSPKKCATIVGHTMGSYHPHGDASIYDSLVRLAQPWKMRYPLIEIQGNKGSISGDPAAAYRYTEAKLTPIGELMVKELEFKSVPHTPTYDDSSVEPVVMPSMFPNVLCNGNKGIAVGMSSDVLPHNLNEAVNAINLYIDKPMVTVEDILEVMPGPDLPTGGIITNIGKAREVYASGRGTFEVKSKYHIETRGKFTHIVFTEIPYLVEIEKGIVGKVKQLALDGKLQDVHNIENNTGRNGLEIRIILKPNSSAERVLSVLFDNTGLKNNIRMGLTILKDGKPVESGILGLIESYVTHRHNVITNISVEKKEKAEARFHIVEGLVIAMQDIDGVIEIVKNSSTRIAAKNALIKEYELSEIQAGAILDMRISQINKMDAIKLADEKESLSRNILILEDIVNNPKVREKIIKNSLADLVKKFGDERRTTLSDVQEEILIDNRDMIVALHDNNEISVYKPGQIVLGSRGRAGKKLIGKPTKNAINFNASDMLIAFDDNGRSYHIPSHTIDLGVGQYLNDIDERIKGNITYITSFNASDMAKDYLVIITSTGIVKKSKVSEYRNFKSYTYAIRLKDGDSVMYATTANDDEFVFMHSDTKMNKFSVSKINASSRHTIGSKGMEADVIIGATIMGEEDDLIMFGRDGKGKLTRAKDFSTSVKAGRGQLTYDGVLGISKRCGKIISIIGVDGKVLSIKLDEMPYKQPRSLGVKIFGGEISTVVL